MFITLHLQGMCQQETSQISAGGLGRLLIAVRASAVPGPRRGWRARRQQRAAVPTQRAVAAGGRARWLCLWTAGVKISIFGLPWGACAFFTSGPFSAKCRACWCWVQKEFAWRRLILGWSEKGSRGLILASEMTRISLILFGFYHLCKETVLVRRLLRGIDALIACSLWNQDHISKALKGTRSLAERFSMRFFFKSS